VPIGRLAAGDDEADVGMPGGPPRSVVFVHGAGSGPDVFDGWTSVFPGADVVAPDLHEGLEVGSASMHDYARRVASVSRERARPLLIVGWSMGGLVAMMAAGLAAPDALVLLEPSPPAETQGVDPGVPLVSGTFDPEREYGSFPDGVPARRESSLARSERKRGLSVASLPCPAVVVFGAEFAEERGRAVASRYGCASLEFEGVDHWGLVLSLQVRTRIGVAIFGGTHLEL
jgi:pimeloyl-ACP methyl ester carboxylesterase